MPDSHENAALPVDRRTILRLAAASSLPVAGATGLAGAQTGLDCEGEHPCAPQIRCFSPTKGHPQNAVWSDSHEHQWEVYGRDDPIEEVTGIDAIAVYRGRVDGGDEHCKPTWDLFVAWEHHYNDGENFPFDLSISVDATETSTVVMPQDPNIRVWLERDPEELTEVDDDATDVQVLEEHYREEDVLDVTKYDEEEILVDALFVAAGAALTASGAGTGVTAGVGLLGALVGLSESDSGSSHDDKIQLTNANTPEQGKKVAFLHVPQIELQGKQDRPISDLRRAEIDIDLSFISSNESEAPDYSHTLELGWREDRPLRLVGEFRTELIDGDFELELRNADGEVLETFQQDGDQFDVWVSPEKFPLRIVEVFVASADDVLREVREEDFVSDIAPYETVQKDLSEQNERVVAPSGAPQYDRYVPVRSESWDEPWNVYLPIGTDAYATADVGFQKPQDTSHAPGVPEGHLNIVGEELTYWISRDQSRSLRGSIVDYGFELPGHVYVKDDELRYVDENEEVRALSGTATKRVSGRPGSLWIEDGRLAFVSEGRQKVVVEPEGTGPVEVELEELTVDSTSVEVGDSLEVTASYANAGGEGTESVWLTVGDRTVLEQEIVVAAGASDTVSWTVDVQRADVGEPTLAVEFVDSSSSASTELSVQTLDTDATVVVESYDVDREYALPGETVVHAGQYTNTGGEGTVRSRLSVGDRLESVKEHPLEAGETISGPEEFSVTEADLGVQTVTMEFVGSGSTGSDELHVLERNDGGFTVSELSVAEDAVPARESVDVTVSVSNSYSDSTTSDVLRLWFGDQLVHEARFELDRFGSREFDLSVDTRPEDIGTRDVRAELAQSGKSKRTEIEVLDPCGGADGLQIDSLSIPSDLRVGTTSTVTATFTYCGEDSSPGAPELFLDGRSVGFLYDAFEPYEPYTTEFEVTPTAGEWGEVSLRLETNGDEATEIVEITPAPFGVEIDEAAVEGETVAVTAAVSNEGETVDVQPVELRVDGRIADTVTAELGAGSTFDVELSASVATGEHSIVVASRTDEDHETVKRTPAEVTLTLGSISDPVSPGSETLDVPVTVENTGGTSTTADVVASVGDGEATETLQLDAGESATATLGIPVELTPAEDVSADVRVVVDGREQATESATVSVRESLKEELGYEPLPAGPDGLYRDVNGDGDVSNGDITTFFSNQHTPEWNERPELFDFDGDGDVGQGDVITLFEYVNGS